MIKRYSRKIKVLILFNVLIINLNYATSQCATFDPIGPLCTGTTAPDLPLVSNEGISGTWFPTAIDMSVVGTQTFQFFSSDPSCTDFITLDVVVDQTPTVAINSLAAFTGSVCVNGTLPLSASSPSDPAISYVWIQNTLPSPVISGGVLLNYNPTSVPTPNPLNITLIGSFSAPSTNSCAGQATAAITVNPQPAATISIPTPTAATFCAGGSVLLTANVGVGLTYQWQVGGVNIPSATSQTFTATTAGSYTVVVTNVSGCSRTSAPRVVTVNPLPIASISYAGSPFCGSGSVSVTQTGQAGGTYAALPAGLSLTAGTGAINLATSTVGTYTVTYSFTNGTCPNTTTTAVIVNPPPAATISYTGSPFCPTGTANVTRTGTAGGTYSSTAGLTINSATGQINLATSTPGTYIITYTIAASGSCALFTTTASITINPLPVATISYAGSPFCQTGLGSVTQTGTAGGTYTSTAGLDITASTGQINLLTSTPGTYTVTYTFTAAGCTNTTTTSVTINALPTATISYTGSPFCATGTASVTQTGVAGGTYTSTAGLSINAGTGAINLATSTAGTYTITYTFTAGGCTNTATATVTINALPVATISYTGSPFCATATASVTQTGTAGGAYSSTAGLIISATTGLVNLATSTPGTYTVTYTFTSAGGCTNTATTLITINALPTATISYLGSPFCGIGTASVTQTGTAGGTYTSTSGLTIAAATGLVNLATSTAGTYTVTYTFTSAGCTNTATTSITIQAAPSATISYTGSPFCPTGTASVTRTGTAGGTYSSTAGLSLDPSTGAINLATSTPGTYIITYTIAASGSCLVFSTTASITINALPTATISYAGSPFCGIGTASVTQTGTAGGTYTSTAGLTIAAGTGQINLATSTAGTYTVTYTFTSGGCTNTATSNVTISAGPLATVTASGSLSICSGSSVTLTANAGVGLTYQWQNGGVNIPGETNSTLVVNAAGSYTVVVTNLSGCSTTSSASVITITPSITPTFTSIAPICSGGTFILSPISLNGIFGSWLPSVNNTATTTYTFTPLAGQCASTTTMTVVVNAPVTPNFVQVGPICSGGVITLPTISPNGVTGTWSPAVNNTATTTYTFTPTAGQCATTTTMTVVVNSNLTPNFVQIAPICAGGVLNFPLTSPNGITGSWLPLTNNAVTTVYTFTPDAGQCATNASMTVVVNPIVTPSFTPISPVCFGTAVTLPPTDNGGITGSWSPAFNSTASSSYLFTPTAGQCATTAFIAVTIIPISTTTFNQVGPICSGATVAALPTTSTNGVIGTWLPATVSNTATATYTFTPSATSCGTSTTMTITVNPNITPTFTQLGPICSGATLTFPPSSNEGIPGAWTPAPNNLLTTTYTFTPTAGQCATTATMTVVVNPILTPSFAPVGPICSGAIVGSLPIPSLNGVSGTWAPPVINNTASTSYLFTPSVGQCASTAVLTINVQPNVVPTFTQIAPICSGGSIALPPVSLPPSSIFGSWSPAVNNTATTTYTFTPIGSQCATTTTMTVTVNPNVTPTFTAVGPICAGATGSSLQLPSNEGISGTWTPSSINNTVTTSYVFAPSAGQCALGTTFTVVVNPNITPTFTQVAPICSGASLAPLPNPSNNGITGTWSPSLNNTATTTYTFTPDAGQCAITATMTIVVNPNVTPTFTPISTICFGASMTLPTISLNLITGTWTPNVVNSTASTSYLFTPDPGQCATLAFMGISVVPNAIPTFNAIAPICSGASLIMQNPSNNGVFGTWSPAVNNTATTTYTFTPDAGQCAVTSTMTVVVNPNLTPTFTAVAPICSGATLPPLPNPSDNGVFGSWTPVLNNVITTNYTFTPDPGVCATSQTLTITVNPNITPTFVAVGPICAGASVGSLQVPSNEGINGIWSPSTINNTTTTTYTFTPAVGECAVPTTLTIVVNPILTPTFTTTTTICSGATYALPLISDETISGTWSPAFDNTSSATYTFTPNTGQCGTVTTLSITVTPNVTPTFTAVAPICSGAALAPLPVLSDNGVSGTWDLPVNNTATTTYTFTPSTGVCAIPVNITIVVNPNITPTFAAVGPICTGTVLSPLPTTSNNGITGTWDLPLNNTATTTYTFTPDAPQCAVQATLTIVVNQLTVPTFTQVAPICAGATLAPLPNLSNNGITGFWTPALNNTATTTYTFTPVANQCADVATMTIVVNPIVTPTFTTTTTICSGAAYTLPPISDEGIGGTWSPTFSNTTSGTYTFTPSAGQCAVSTTLTITVTPNVTPTFTPVAPICAGAILAPLPSPSLNGISGIWTPAVNNTATTTYTFTPSAGQCAILTTMTIVVNPIVTPTFTTVGPICFGDPIVALSTVNPENITGTWSPALDNTTTTTYTFTPDVGQCAVPTTMTVVVNPIPSISITPTSDDICSGQATIVSIATSPVGASVDWTVVENGTSGASAGSGNTINQTLSTTAQIDGTTTYTIVPSLNGCAGSSIDLIVTVHPIADASFTVSNYCDGIGTAPVITGTAGGAFSFTPPATDGATIDLATGLISNGVLGTTYIIQYAVVGICPASTQQAVSFNAVPVSPNTGNDTSYCTNAIFVSMTASSNNGGNLNWFDDAALTNNIGSGTNVVPSNVIGVSTYYVTETVNGCQSLPNTVDVTVFDLPTAPILSSDATYCNGDSLQKVYATGNLGSTFNWYDDALLTNLIGTTDSILPKNILGVSTYYATEISAQGCSSAASSTTVTINDCFVLDVPTAFTPDGDGVNESWLIAELNVRYPNNNVTIFNRWGQVLYNSDGYLIPWDGKFDNKDLPVGSYYYIIDFNDALDTPNATGIVTIIRN